MKNILVLILVVSSIFSCKKESFINGTPTPGSSNESVAMRIWRDNRMAMTVSYTHLDVYKRQVERSHFFPVVISGFPAIRDICIIFVQKVNNYWRIPPIRLKKVLFSCF